ncbi:helix-turn-helix domain-containing protein [Euzebya sp.]|uniref:helix-turn-helix domain-containing protein n=1 Tax=Euzebya sp. TaxID=1971409 RepID=UPI00351649F5
MAIRTTTTGTATIPPDGDADAVADALLERYRALPAFITVQQAADVIGISRSSAYRAVDRGDLPVVRFSGRLHVPVAVLLALMGLTEPPPTAAMQWLDQLAPDKS